MKSAIAEAFDAYINAVISRAPHYLKQLRKQNSQWFDHCDRLCEISLQLPTRQFRNLRDLFANHVVELRRKLSKYSASRLVERLIQPTSINVISLFMDLIKQDFDEDGDEILAVLRFRLTRDFDKSEEQNEFAEALVLALKDVNREAITARMRKAIMADIKANEPKSVKRQIDSLVKNKPFRQVGKLVDVLHRRGAKRKDDECNKQEWMRFQLFKNMMPDLLSRLSEFKDSFDEFCNLVDSEHDELEDNNDLILMDHHLEYVMEILEQLKDRGVHNSEEEYMAPMRRNLIVVPVTFSCREGELTDNTATWTLGDIALWKPPVSDDRDSTSHENQQIQKAIAMFQPESYGGDNTERFIMHEESRFRAGKWFEIYEDKKRVRSNGPALLVKRQKGMWVDKDSNGKLLYFEMWTVRMEDEINSGIQRERHVCSADEIVGYGISDVDVENGVLIGNS